MLVNIYNNTYQTISSLYEKPIIKTAQFFFFILIFTAGNAMAADEITYDLAVIGIEQSDFDKIRTTFDNASILRTQKSTPLISVSNLRSHLDNDIKTMDKILRAEGYYNGSITEQFSRSDNHFDIKINIIPGPLYTYDQIKIIYRESEPEEAIKTKINAAISLQPGMPARSDPILADEAVLINILPQHGYPFAEDIERDLVIDHRTRKMNITFILNTGVRRKMGETTFEGLESVNESYVVNFITWQQGDYYNQNFINDLRARLIKTNLFAGVNIDVIPKDEDQVNITVRNIESKHRTIGTSIGYSTAEGVGGEVSWEHRNFLNSGNRFKATARAAEIEQSLAGLLELPHFRRLDQTLSFEGVTRRQDTDAFFAHTIEARAGLDRVITPELALLANVEMEYSDILDATGDRDFFLVALPFGARWDSSDNLLDPSRGIRASLITAPSIAVGKRRSEFIKTEFRASTYFSIVEEDKLILALRTRLGSIVGADNEVLPATRRFFSGGGGSIRGYAFQRVGPLGPDDNPFGGLSVTEVAAELRWKFENDIGMVLFSEGGNVYDNVTPRFNDFRWAAGIGARYSTGFGPIRFDVAFPLNRRADDSSFQIYISLGQAF